MVGSSSLVPCEGRVLVEDFFARKETHTKERRGVPAWCPGNTKRVRRPAEPPRALGPSVETTSGSSFRPPDALNGSFRPPSYPLQGPWVAPSKSPWSSSSRGPDALARTVLLEGDDMHGAEFEELLLRRRCLEGQEALFEQRRKKLLSYQEDVAKKAAARGTNER